MADRLQLRQLLCSRSSSKHLITPNPKDYGLLNLNCIGLVIDYRIVWSNPNDSICLGEKFCYSTAFFKVLGLVKCSSKDLGQTDIFKSQYLAEVGACSKSLINNDRVVLELTRALLTLLSP